MSTDEEKRDEESPYKMAKAAYYPMVHMIVERTAREVSNADGTIADMFWIMNWVLVEMVRRYCPPGREVEHLEWEAGRMISLLTSCLGRDQTPDSEPIRPTTSDVGRA